MKQIKIMFLGIFSLLLMAFIAFIPMHTQAATITNGQTVKLLNQGKQFYKFTLEDDALVQFQWINNADNEACCYIYTNKTRSNTLKAFFIKNKSGRLFLAMKKGTYYLDLYDDYNPTTKVTVNWTPASKYDKGNFNARTAQNLEPDVLVRVPQVGFYSYYRWYKIKVTRAHKITITLPYGPQSKVFLVTSKYDSSISSFLIGTDEQSKTTTTKLAVGTYYILVMPASPDSQIGDAISFKWK
jgi:hypothetical protein